ncbi:phosphopantothenate--cysteine ligase [Candidatus Enterococcus mangumiae]|uniref:Phosphopantothenate-cysteine ligase n=1 Tax=Candidatus Enterococcus mangumiae TaxID=2230878 RepID=A0ABZ2ST32_9ENTE|nr:phosphopantothenate--cysteine ligase [Enterococcus sp. DIV1094]MBO0490974.1 phosphopantothenate--cysteine ligase [Enterococcus sp. DIV1094]
MKVLITAGGTSERIDQVRSITNHSSGRLGKAIAEAFLTHPSVTIDYVTTQPAVKPSDSERLTFHLIESTQELLDTFERLMQEKSYDAIIHSMAVSDFTPAFSLSEQQLAERLSKESLTPDSLSSWLEATEQSVSKEAKISSDTDYLVLTLKKTPKIIRSLRQWQPKATIVGFKLLVDVSKEQLLEVAKKSLITNQTDYILANDLTQINETRHHGYLLSKNGEVTEAYTKQEIAQCIVSTILK